MKWADRKDFPKDAYEEFVIRFRWKHDDGNSKWVYQVIHTAMMPVHLYDKEWEWLDESQLSEGGRVKELEDCLGELMDELELFYANGKYDGDMRIRITKAKQLIK
jgi:hypothetical protein